ncbi:hypothetical protein [Moorena bouillonii]|uniref:hypothetical protein n=1 Tax=Moorena bouillonii TaxID=207920 RepID=UPI0011816B89|nr:hypothetical protein [Moorena bouillonii]
MQRGLGGSPHERLHQDNHDHQSQPFSNLPVLMMLVWLRVGIFYSFTLAALPCRGRTLQYPGISPKGYASPRH